MFVARLSSPRSDILRGMEACMFFVRFSSSSLDILKGMEEICTFVPRFSSPKFRYLERYGYNGRLLHDLVLKVQIS